MKKYFILIIVLCLIIIGEGVFIFFNSSKEVKPEKNYTNIPEKEENIVDSNIWLYAADYQTANLPLYYTAFKNTYYLQDIVLPYINIDSEAAREANKEIKGIYDFIISMYKMGIEDHLTYIDICNYDYARYDNVGSVLITYGIGATSIVHPVYVAYSFDLDTGEKLSFEEVYEKASISSEEINLKVREAIEYYLSAHLNGWVEDVNKYIEISYNNYLESVKTGEIVYYLADGYTIEVVVELSIPVDTGSFDTLLTIESW